MRRGRGLLAAVAALGVATPGAATAQTPTLVPSTPNDLFALGQGSGDTPARAATQTPPEPPDTATPVVPCGPGSKPEPGVDGRVPAGSGTGGLWCNATDISHQGTSGGFKTLRYIDAQGHECAYYDTALLFPTNAVNPAGPSLGVAVLDMSDPAHPVQTDTLNTPTMLTPHESVVLNVQRGLLAAVNGNPATEPGEVTMYDIHNDCRHPVLDFALPLAKFGHESGFSMDGRTFYATATAYNSITAIDVSDPTQPHVVWQGNLYSHGMSLSNDGNRAYLADPIETSEAGLTIIDTSQIQARNPFPHVREITRMKWKDVSIPQNAIPFTENGHPYLLEFDEYTASTLNPSAPPDIVGAGRIIDIADETHPRVIANLRLQVDQPSDHRAAQGDPGTFSGAQGYAAHYCNIPSRVDPKIVACSFIVSGLRVFDISDLLHPKEIAYYVAPTAGNTENGYQGSDYAMSQPVIIPARREIWYTDGGSGFYVVRISPNVWPASQPEDLTAAASPAASSCALRQLTFRLHSTRFGPIRRVRVLVNGRLSLARKGRRLKSVTVLLPGSGPQTIRIITYDRRGRAIRSVRRVAACSKTAPHSRGRRTAHRRR